MYRWDRGICLVPIFESSLHIHLNSEFDLNRLLFGFGIGKKLDFGKI